MPDAHVAHSDSPQHSDGAGQEPISRVVVAVAASKSLIRTRIDISQRAGQRDVGDHVVLAAAERVDDRT